MIFLRKHFVFLTMVIFSKSLIAQNRLDSLWILSQQYYSNEKYESSINTCQKIIKENKDASNSINCFLLMGQSYLKLNKPNKTIETIEALNKYFTEDVSNEKSIHYSLLMGDAYSQLKEYKNAIESYKSAYTKTPPNELSILFDISTDIGYVFHLEKNYLKSITWFQISLDHAIKSNNISNQIITETKIAKIYSNYGDLNKARSCIQSALDKAKLHSDLGLTKLTEETKAQLEKIQTSLLNSKSEFLINSENKKTKKFQDFLEKEKGSIQEIDRLTQDKQLITNRLKAQTDSFEKTIFRERLLSFKQKQILFESNVNLKIAKEKNNYQKNLLIASITFILLLIILSSLLYRFYITKKKISLLLFKKNKEILDQKSQIQLKAKHISDSINYSLDIQKAFLPDFNDFTKSNPKSFLFHKPKDQVSGDFFWFKETENILYLALIDCTGHGVPGALMSIICHETICSTIDKNIDIPPHKYLNKIQKDFSQKLSENNKYIGGMDLSLVQIDKKNNTLKFSGARNFGYLIQDGNVKVLKNSKFSIGFRSDVQTLPKINSEVISLSNKCTLYLFSDGFINQKGGKENKKYYNYRFKSFLGNLEKTPIDSQKTEIEREFKGWKRENLQGDDVMIFGLILDQFSIN